MMLQNVYTHLKLLFLVMVGVWLGTAVHAVGLADYAHRAEIKSEGAGPFFHLPLTLAVYRNSLSPGLRDLRVFNAAGEMIPHALTLKTDIPQPKVTQTALRGFPLYSDQHAVSQGIQIRQEKNGSLVAIETTKPTVTRKLTGVILDASHMQAPLVALEIALDEYLQAFQRFRIEASDDLKNWNNVQDAASIAVLEQDGARIEQRRVEFPPLGAKYLRLTWLDPQEIPSLPKVTATSATMPQQSQPEMFWTEAISPVRNKNGELIYRLGGTLPVERIRFLLPQINTLSPAQILVRSNDKQLWRRLSDTVLYRLATKGEDFLSPDIELSGESIAELQIKLDARAGGVGATPLQVKIAIAPQQLVFLARGDGPFTLAWGLAGANASALPLTTLVPAYRYQDGLPGDRASIGIDTNSPASGDVDRKATDEKMDSAELNKWVLWGVLVGGAALLLWMAWKLIRSGENTNT